jgi:heme-degrading monooxygenase HmoA
LTSCTLSATVLSQKEIRLVRGERRRRAAERIRRMTVADVSRFSVYGRMTAQPGQRDALIERFEEVLRIGIPGLESCSINAVLDDPDTIWVTEIWKDKAAHDTGTSSDVVVSATKRVMSLVAGPLEGSYGQLAYLHDGGTA